MKLTYIYILCAFLLISTGCEKRLFQNDPDAPFDGKTITFTLSNSSATPQATKATLAAEDLLDNEKVINRIDIFFYNEDGSQQLFYPTASQLINIGNEVTIRVPGSIAEAKLFNNNCKVYMMVNCQIDRNKLTGITLAAMKQMEMTNDDERTFNTDTAPKDFFMESDEIAVILSEQQSQNLGKIILKRAAAKIVVDITRAVIPGYTPGSATVRITNYLNKTMVSNAHQYQGTSTDFKTATKVLASNEADENKPYTMDKSNPIYTYANDWQFNAERETYVLIELEWTKNGEITPRTYYYRIPFSFLKNSDDATVNKYRVRRNFVYQFGVDVSQLGGLDPADAVDLSANFDLIDWTDRTIDASILSYHYLFVYHQYATITNKYSYTWEYKSSLPISVDVSKVYSNEYTASGTISEKIYSTSDKQYPEIALSTVGDKTYLTFNSMVPINYVPLYISASVFNAAQLFANITLTIYPKIYVTASPSLGGTPGGSNITNGVVPARSSSIEIDGQRIYRAGSYTLPDNGTADGTNADMGPNYSSGTSGQTNGNFFTVHYTSRSDEDILNGIQIGDPTQRIDHPGASNGNASNIAQWQAFCPDYYQTLTDNASNNIISPQFTIATQRGITTSKNTKTAQQRCNTYREAQHMAGSWRVPTFAELNLVRKMQLDPNSAIKELFQSTSSTGWRTARGNYSIILGEADDAKAFIQSTAADQSVRCIHDDWKHH